ncbi:hypothetical protein KEM54_003787 [Ascosphaera aggregata]|nr:hypothetical protein KEM54_003787 [Ascosphaera aggregata]
MSNVEVEGGATAQSLPEISGSALAHLTARIEKDLRKGKESIPKQDKKAKSQHSAKEGNGGQKKIQQPTPLKSDKKQSNKRDRNGDKIAEAKGKPSAAPAPAPAALGSGHGKDGAVKSRGELLEQEIYATGGSKEDYKLLENVDSDSEVEGQDADPSNFDESSLRQDLAGLLKGIDPSYVIPELPAKKQELKRDKNADKKGADKSQKKPSPAKGKKEDGQTGDRLRTERKEESKERENKKKEKKAVGSSQNAGAKNVTVKGTRAAPETRQTKPRNSKFIMEPRPDWHATPLPPIPSAKSSSMAPRYIVDRVHEYANTLLDNENEVYSASQDSSTHKFYSTIVTTGTLSDKTSALTLAIQESPLHNIKSLDVLIGLANKRSRAQAVDVLRSLKDLFGQGDILPGNRRLRAFYHQPAILSAFADQPNWTSNAPLPAGLQKSHLVYWAFEDYLKKQYFEMLKILEVWCNDEIEFSRSRAVSYVYELLKEKPEQEANLLRLLVNKLGDPHRKIASRASYLLLQLEQAHPLMKLTIVSAMEADILFRPGQSQHAKYYAIITLNQTILSRADENVAGKLLDIYFSLFVTILKQKNDTVKGSNFPAKPGHKKNKKAIKREKEAAKGQAQEQELREKLTAGILTGVNRAYPFTNADSGRLSQHIDTLFRITHSSNITTSIQALMLIQQLTSIHQVAADRFYRTLYESLLDPRLITSSKQSLYLNLLYKSLKSDLSVKRVKAFVKRLLQVLSLHSPSFVCGVFFLIRELEKIFPSLSSLIDEPEADEDDDEEVFRDVPDEDDDVTTAVTGSAQPQSSEDSMQKKGTGYDARKRDPNHSNADRSCLWELLPYLSHFHPSVSVNASHLLQHTAMSGKADLSLHTLIHFLDRFVYRNPKQQTPLRGASIMQPLAGGDSSNLLVTGSTRRVEEPVNKETFWKKKGEEVAAEDVFFHDYFSRLGVDKQRKQQQKAKKAAKAGSDDESDAESEIWQALVDSRPELEGAEGSEDDMDLDELESAMGTDEEQDEELASGDEDVIFNDESDVPEEEGKPSAEASEGEEEEEPFGLDESDDEAFVDSDAELPSDLEASMEEEMAAEIAKQNEEKKSDRGKKRRKLKHLPTFASVEDYAKLLEGEDEGM